MSASLIPLESEVTAWLVKLIESEGLHDAIAGKEALASIAEGVRQAHFIPSFGIDYRSRLASAEAAEHVLNQLTLLEIISINMSISLTTGEVLRPDILCFNPESRTLVVFEIKRAAEAERQTVTELGGYEQELRNLLPFVGDYDICFVVVATEWSTLLSHAVGALNAWSGKRCLALKLALDVPGKDLSLSCYLPEAWHLTGSPALAPEALQTINLYLIEDEPDMDEDWPPRSVLTAMDVMARAGDRAGSHGFMMLWKDVNGMGRCVWGLTLCGIDPYVMHAWWRDHGLPQRDSDIALFFDRKRADMPGLVPGSIFAHVDEARALLSDRYDLELEDAFSWEMQIKTLRIQALPRRFEFWGSLGQYAQKFVCNPSVRDRYMPYIGHNDLDWTDPDVALPLLQNLSQGTPFPGGQIRCSDAFKVGMAIGTLILALRNAVASEAAALKLEPLVRWSQYEALRYAIEMKQISDGTDDIEEPIPTLTNNTEKRLQAAEAMRLWIFSHLLGDDHPVHQHCFELGCSGPFLFGDLALQLGYQLPQEPRDQMLGELREIMKRVISQVASSVGYQVRSDSYKAFADYLSPYLDIGSCHDETSVKTAVDAMPDDELIAQFPTEILKGVDSIVPVVFHHAKAIPISAVDWDWLKAGIRALYNAGNQHGAVIRHLDGTIGTGCVDRGMTGLLAPISNPSEEVYFYDNLAGHAIMAKITWQKLIETVTSD
ncbi:TPA: hypothetical protein ACKP9T_001578 [Pseudomonas aeruginosa]|uniref:hypothetical protein n=2 Tax=Pseudomonas aeruginosa TaxID=287 RepID=UPI00117AEB99|nr:MULTISPECIES: hypothetical protein [Pseudomonas]EKV4052206.1 hypothetical protein [Pseudomonas aeruginosa]MBG5021813.1 hypothetical protein [Pseudomonas aeruginosa]MBG6785875.1 hypothetical protein [Pseudomonas aeruginosa]MBH9215333.1 hypothetical protein [Pseudomonas aeruginosa]MBH9375974.1 hypothetical protein [Pseudomonas aeruginosa]